MGTTVTLQRAGKKFHWGWHTLRHPSVSGVAQIARGIVESLRQQSGQQRTGEEGQGNKRMERTRGYQGRKGVSRERKRHG